MTGSQDLGDRVILTHPSNPNTSVEILKFGAHVLSWKVDGQEKLWLGDTAVLDGSAPVRGGIPVVFPVYLTSQHEPLKKMPHHGFARISNWSFLGQNSKNSVQFGLSAKNAAPEHFKNWPVENFGLVYTVELGENNLKTTIDVSNPSTNDCAFDFHCLLHTHLRVGDIHNVSVENVQGLTVDDKILGKVVREQSAIKFDGTVQKIYNDFPINKAVDVFENGVLTHTVGKGNMPDMVVWNPWLNGAAQMADFGPPETYKTMLCVEPGHIGGFVTLEPGHTWSAYQLLTA